MLSVTEEIVAQTAGRAQGLEHVNLIDALGMGRAKFESKQGRGVTRAPAVFGH
jgi:hypothetical protein